GDDGFDVGVKQRFATTNNDRGGAEHGQLVQPLKHCVNRDRLGRGVVLVAVSAGQIAPSHRGYVCEDGAILLSKAFSAKLEFACLYSEPTGKLHLSLVAAAFF